jgi:hypothetical protein
VRSHESEVDNLSHAIAVIQGQGASCGNSVLYIEWVYHFYLSIILRLSNCYVHPASSIITSIEPLPWLQIHSFWLQRQRSNIHQEANINDVLVAVRGSGRL